MQDDFAAAIRARVAAIQRELAACAENPPMLLPVTKTQPVPTILALSGTGVSAIGENRVQEMLEKYPALCGEFAIHLIGRLQTNKIKYIMGRASMLQSLDREALATEIDRRAQDRGLIMPALVEVNIGQEPQKAGLAPEEVEPFVRRCAKLPGIRVCGLMTVMPLSRDSEALRPLFREMRALFDRLRAEAIAGVSMETLSMGMSGDYRVAAQEGSTLVRVGTAIFGNRS